MINTIFIFSIVIIFFYEIYAYISGEPAGFLLIALFIIEILEELGVNFESDTLMTFSLSSNEGPLTPEDSEGDQMSIDSDSGYSGDDSLEDTDALEEEHHDQINDFENHLKANKFLNDNPQEAQNLMKENGYSSGDGENVETRLQNDLNQKSENLKGSLAETVSPDRANQIVDGLESDQEGDYTTDSGREAFDKVLKDWRNNK